MELLKKAKHYFKDKIFKKEYGVSTTQAASAYYHISLSALEHIYALKHLPPKTLPSDISSMDRWLSILDDILFALSYIVRDEKGFLPDHIDKIVREYIPKTEYEYEEDQYKQTMSVITEQEKELKFHYYLNEKAQESLLTRYYKGWKYFTEYYTSLWD